MFSRSLITLPNAIDTPYLLPARMTHELEFLKHMLNNGVKEKTVRKAYLSLSAILITSPPYRVLGLAKCNCVESENFFSSDCNLSLLFPWHTYYKLWEGNGSEIQILHRDRVAGSCRFIIG